MNIFQTILIFFYICINCIYNNKIRKKYLIHEHKLSNLYNTFNIILLFKINSIIHKLNKNYLMKILLISAILK